MQNVIIRPIEPTTMRPGSRPAAATNEPPEHGYEEDERPSAMLHAHLPAELPSPSRRVLVIEDEPFCARAYASALLREGFTVDVASDAEQVLGKLLDHRYCAVVADLCLPGMSGLDLLRCVRVHDLDTVMLLVTAAADFSVAMEALRHGAFQLLLKPLTSKQLVGEVRRAARLHELAVRQRQAMRLLAAEQIEEGRRGDRERLLDHALAAVHMAFQPIHDAAGRCVGHEALLRSGVQELRGPLEILQLAEELGRLPDVGRASRAAATRAFVACAPPDALLFVNLHARDLLDDELLDPSNPLLPLSHRVVLELTERAPLADNPEVTRRVGRLRAAGFRIAIDDLGSGYAGLNSLVQLEPEFVKLDLALVRDVHINPLKHRLISLIVESCKCLQIQVVAEGIEKAEELRTLQDLGCALFQGYLLGRPGPLPPL